MFIRAGEIAPPLSSLFFRRAFFSSFLFRFSSFSSFVFFVFSFFVSFSSFALIAFRRCSRLSWSALQILDLVIFFFYLQPESVNLSLELLKLWTLLPSRSPSSTFWGEKCGIIGFEKRGACWINNENVFSSLTIPTCSGRTEDREDEKIKARL